ncbi:DNA replication initiation factor cdc45-like protein, partial [Colletotrichum incanum]
MTSPCNFPATKVPFAAIYFDGFLPASKSEVRLERILKVSSSLKVYRSGFPNGCPARQIASTRISLPPLFPTDAPKRDQPLIPPPPFLVAAVVDKLCQTTKYAALVRLVPGEADAYCAEDVLRNGGTILTSDSDLTIHDLKTGAVAFFRDLHIASTNERDSLVGPKFSPSDIAKRLQLPEEQGMRRFGYELSKSSRPKFAQVLENCKGDVSDPDEFRNFCIPYETLETTDWSDVPVLSGIDNPTLDARLSEVVLQCLILAYAQEEDKQEACLNSIKQVLSVAKDSNLVPWDVVHLSAQVQATLYSLRILAQVLNLMHEIKAEKPVQGSKQLRELLATLPPLTEYPSVNGTIVLLASMKANNTLANITAALDLPEEALLPSKESKGQRKRKKTTEIEPETRPEKKVSSNPFDILGI